MYFLHKRAHLCTLARGREMFGHIEDMTPARFDLFSVIYKNITMKGYAKVNGYAIEQAKLTQQLGLSRQTVWKTVQRLIELGLLEVRKAIFPCMHNVVQMTAEGVRRFRLALNAAFSERRPLPLAAPAQDAPRYWRRPELADEIIGPDGKTVMGHDGKPALPEKIGREVGKIFSRFAWKRLDPKQGARGRRARHLQLLDRMIHYAGDVARELGNITESIYVLKHMEECDD
jgi:DNA-binding MarR family transcriptional regulator